MAWTKIGTVNIRFKDEGWRSARHPRWCPGCGEERLVTETTIAGRTSFYCDVCSHRWIAQDDELTRSVE